MAQHTQNGLDLSGIFTDGRVIIERIPTRKRKRSESADHISVDDGTPSGRKQQAGPSRQTSLADGSRQESQRNSRAAGEIGFLNDEDTEAMGADSGHADDMELDGGQSTASRGPLSTSRRIAQLYSRSFDLRQPDKQEGFYTSQLDPYSRKGKYAKYPDWQQRPARVSKPRKKSAPPASSNNPEDEDTPMTGKHDQPELNDEALDSIDTTAAPMAQQSPPATPVNLPYGMPTPDTRPKVSPDWHMTTVSQIGEPYHEAEDDWNQHWTNAYVGAVDSGELPRGSEIDRSRLTSSPAVRSQIHRSDLKDVAGIHERKIVGLKVRTDNGGKLKFKKLKEDFDWTQSSSSE